MKKLSLLTVLIMCFAMIFSCTNKKQIKQGIIYLDVKKDYNEKSIDLEEIADIKYIQPEFNNNYLFNYAYKYITPSTIVLFDFQTRDILFFSIDGKTKSKFNRTGNGPGEYSLINSLVYDEQEDKLFALTITNIIVYSSEGHYYYTIDLPNNNQIRNMVNYDKESLLLYHEGSAYNKNFVRISKQDGSVLEEININHKEIDLSVNRKQDGEITIKSMGPIINIVKNKYGFLLNDHSNDTVYFYAENELKPVLVTTPPIFEIEPYIYINGFFEIGDYLFLQKIKAVRENNVLPIDYLMINKNDHSVYKQKIFSKDYTGKDINLTPEKFNGSFDSRICLIELTLDELNEANADNRLSGKLKELVEASDEDSNNIFMLLYFK